MVCVLAGVSASPAVAQTLRCEGSAGLSSGTYTLATPTTTWAFANGLGLDVGRLFLRVTVPAYLQRPLTVDPAVSSRRVYVGDPVGQVGVRITPSDGASLALRASAKVPMTDSLSFGTGQWDVGVGVSLSRRLGGMTFAGVDLSYWVMGDPIGLALQNPLVVSTSVSGLLGGRWGWLLSATGGQSAVEGFPPFYSVSGGMALLGQVMTLNVSAVVGLSETAPNFAVGIGWSLRLLGR